MVIFFFSLSAPTEAETDTYLGSTSDESITVGIMSDTAGEAYGSPSSPLDRTGGSSYPYLSDVSDYQDFDVFPGVIRHLFWNYPVASGHTGMQGDISFRDGSQYVTCSAARTGEVCESDPLGNERLVGDGICAQLNCVTGSDPVSVDCQGDGCTEEELRDHETTFDGCAPNTGFACDSVRGGLGNDAAFSQDGLCAIDNGGDPICYTGPDEGDHVCKDSSGDFHNTCSQCADNPLGGHNNDRCTTDFDSGNYGNEVGRCNQGECCPMVIEDSSSCSSCKAEDTGKRCDVGGDGTWNGVCALDEGQEWGCHAGDIYYDGETGYHWTDPVENTEGYMCDSDIDYNAGPEPFLQDGMAADYSCRTGSSDIECENGAGSDCTFICPIDTGNKCITKETYPSDTPEFYQEGLCTQAGCADGLLTDHVCYNSGESSTGVFHPDCSSCTQERGPIEDLDTFRGDSCTVSHTSGGNYDAEGLCTTNAACSVGADVCVDHENADEFKEGCSACNLGSLCEVGGTTSFSPDGYCSANDGCISIEDEFKNYVDTNENELFDDEPYYCGEDSTLTRNEVCSVNTQSTHAEGDIADHEWDGLCVEYAPQYGDDGWKCDTSLITCRFDHDTQFDYESTCGNSVLNSTTTNTSFFEDSTTVDSDFGFSTIEDSEVRKSNISQSTISRSNIYDSQIEGTTLSSSTVLSSELCPGIQGSNVKISDNVLISGILTYDGREVSSPFRIDQLCDGAEIDATGFLTFNETSVSDGMDLEIYYVSSETGYDVTVDMSQVGGSSSMQLSDDGSAPDNIANDGIYTGLLEDISFAGGDDDVSITAAITTDTASWDVTSNLIVRNSLPSASLDITSLIGDTEVSPSSTVILESSYSHETGIDACRYANEDESNLEDSSWDDCESSQYWNLLSQDGLRRVFMEVRSISGTNTIVSDSIEIDSHLTGDTTSPTRPVVIADYNYTRDNSTLDFRWYNSTDPEQAILGNPIFYDLWLCDSGTSECDYKGQTRDDYVTLTNLSLKEGQPYHLKVAAFNVENLFSSNASSQNVYVDTVPPGQTTIDTNVSSTEWEDGQDLEFEFSASTNGSLSEIKGFTTSLSRDSETDPDSVIDSNGTSVFSSLPDGYYVLKVAAVDEAGNRGPASEFNFSVSSSAPSVPRMTDSDINASGSSSITYQWTESSHISGIDEYNLQIARDIEFKDIVLDTNTSGTSYTYTNISDGMYFGRVRARNNVGKYSLFSDEVASMADLEPPKFTFRKPEGVVVSASPIINVRTNKVTECTYDSPEIPLSLFDMTNLRNHETRIDLEDDGQYDLEIECRDIIGNTNTTYVSFEVDQGRTPNTLDITDDKDSLYAGYISTVNFTVQDGGVPLGEIHHSKFDIEFDPASEDMLEDGYSIADLGNGVYQAAFVTPNGSSQSDVTISHNETGLQDSVTFDVEELELEVECQGDGCEFLQTDGDVSYQEDYDEYNVVIMRDDVSALEVHECSGSDVSPGEAECILIESSGEGDVCMAFSTECDSDRIAHILDE